MVITQPNQLRVQNISTNTGSQYYFQEKRRIFIHKTSKLIKFSSGKNISLGFSQLCESSLKIFCSSYSSRAENKNFLSHIGYIAFAGGIGDRIVLLILQCYKFLMMTQSVLEQN